MAWWADFSGPPPGAAALRRAGFSGVIRYIGLGSEGKQIHRSEFEDYTRNGMGVLLVAELGTDDAWATLDDYATGVARAQMAVADARAEGIPDYVGIACAADAHATSTQVKDAIQYARGFAAVLGKQRTGFYGFSETSRAVHDADVVGWHWRCGSEPSSADKGWVNFWQRNVAPTVVTAGGTACDINETLAPLGGDTEMDWSDDASQDVIYRLGDFVHAKEFQTGGKNKGDNLTMVTLLLDACYRIEALMKGTDQTGGPSKGTVNQLAKPPMVTLSDTQLAQLADMVAQRVTPGASVADVRTAVHGELAAVTFTTKAQ